MGEKDQTTSKPRKITDSITALLTLSGIMVIGLFGTEVYAFQTATRSQYLSFAAIGLLIAASSLVFGGLLGFLFGIPKTLQDGHVEVAANGEGSNGGTTSYRANTNLEQISDWLTKILVGVGLTQITVLPEKLQQLSTVAARGLDDTDSSRTLVTAVILFFVISGFLFGYLWTRLYLPGAFRQAELSLLVNRVAQASKDFQTVNQKLVELQKQTELDANALSLAQRQLNPSPDIPAISQEDLDKAMAAASRPVRIQVYSQAEKIRADNWRVNKEKMETTIPIFRSLINIDKDDRFHRNHAQLGFALKDQRFPDFKVAEAELAKAIEIRGSWKTEGWLFYEFNRAFCRIMQDDGFKKDAPSTEQSKNIILADLRAAAHDLKKYITNEPGMAKWMSLNNVTEGDLKDVLA